MCLSANTILEIVKQMVCMVEEVGNFSRWSLCVGGAVAAACGGISLSVIQTVGHWQSEAMLIYLRATCGAVVHASSKMGF